MELVAEKYKQTEVGIIPSDWEVKKFGDICYPSKTKINPLTSTENYKCVELEHLSQGSGILLGYANSKDLKSQKAVFEIGDVLFGKLRPYLRKYLFAEFDGVCTTEIWVLKSEKDTSNRFLYQLVQSEKIIEAANLSIGTKMPRAEWKTVSETKIPLPPTKAEQTLIATALSDADALISSLEKLIEKKRAIKQGAMQQLLKPKEGWVVKKLGEVAQLLKGKGLSKSKLSYSGIYSCILYGELFTTYQEVISDVNSNTDIKEGTLSKIGDILFPGSTTTTGIDLAKSSTLLQEGVLLGGDIIIIRRIDSQYDPIFLSYFLNQEKKTDIAQLTKGITIHHLHGTDLMNLEVRTPSLEDQIKYSKILCDMSSEIITLEKKLDKHKMIKQGMMQNLLTGKIRLV